MALYEHIFLARQDLSQAQVDALAAGATEIVENNGGKVVKTETWGLKSLAYKIDRNRKAHFVMLNIDGPGSLVAELERQNRINEDVIRWLTIAVEEHEDGPSVMMRKNDRDKKKRADREDRD
ncbi:30S ribosomal protein S6 [Erythrobacter sp. EC-HK427]|uniref:30S ribosomal protein S6 n=1 Tax=Erythrobacter sp. EC-HK427 TaxID=2038396 RepID=UPI001259E85B|nr:30S ribosomal protein S6 [Erythrobacter sp. EC-HK427]VVT13618.1 30S ribosomal protein S6 [Erythrobacter sp. EC-HK427]